LVEAAGIEPALWGVRREAKDADSRDHDRPGGALGAPVDVKLAPPAAASSTKEMPEGSRSSEGERH
jgi:hypothetical protein